MADKLKSHKLVLHTYFASFTVLSPIDREQFYDEMNNTIRANNTQPDWDGKFNFNKEDGGMITLNLMDIKAVEDFKESK